MQKEAFLLFHHPQYPGLPKGSPGYFSYSDPVLNHSNFIVTPEAPKETAIPSLVDLILI